jgi:7-cyano-7-deazaguanine synthase
MKAIAICSGGLDSTVMLYEMISNRITPVVLSFDYGQRHRIELDFIERTAKKLNLRWILERMPTFNSALTTGVMGVNEFEELTKAMIPKANYDDASQKITVVPNRNMIMIAIAGGYAVQMGAQEIWYAAHSGDHAIYPDCRESFVCALAEALTEGTYEKIQLVAPFINLTKTDIVKRGALLGVPFEDTWSCYDPQKPLHWDPHYVDLQMLQCGKCGTCRERIEAFTKAGIRDPTSYVKSKGVKT